MVHQQEVRVIRVQHNNVRQYCIHARLKLMFVISLYKPL